MEHAPCRASNAAYAHIEPGSKRTRKPKSTAETKIRAKVVKNSKRKAPQVADPVSEISADLDEMDFKDDDSDLNSHKGCIIDDSEEENREIPPEIIVTWREIDVPDEKYTGIYSLIFACLSSLMNNCSDPHL